MGTENELNEQRAFAGGMDFDSDDKTIQPGMYRILFAGRNGPRKKGVIENPKGNILISNAFLPTGTNRCIGSEEDIKTNSLIFFNHNSNGYNGIYRYYINKPGYQNGVIEKLAQVNQPTAYTFDNPSPLNFNEDELITGVAIVENLLYWNNPNDRPQKLDMDKANETGKRRKFNLCFNSSNFGVVTEYTLNVYEKGNPVPRGTLTWVSAGSSWAIRVDEFAAAWAASPLLSLFTVHACGQFAELEMIEVGEFFINIHEITYKSVAVQVGANSGQATYVLYFQANPNLTPGDTVQLMGLPQLTYLNGVPLTVVSGGPTPGNTFASYIFFATGPVAPFTFQTDPGILLYIPLVVLNPDPNQSMVIPENFYPDKDMGLDAAGIANYEHLRTDLFDRGKYPPMCMPTAAYGTDPLREINLVKNDVFQFMVRYEYDNYEKSVFGSISNIPVVNISCDDNKNFGDNDNFIDIDFMDERLNNPSLVCIIKKVTIAVRSHNIGEWRKMQTLEQHQFAGVGQNIFRFFNDQSYNAIAVTETNKPYDATPRVAKSLEFVDDRLFDGGILEGYDKPCIDAKVDIEYQEAPVDRRFNIHIRTYIRNIFNNSPSAAAQQPIWVTKDAAGVLAFGGISANTVPFGGFLDQYLNASSLDRYKQKIPLAGFVSYLAGTDYFGISVQNPTGAMNGNNYYNGTGASSRKDIRQEIQNGNVYHDTIIKDVPPGRYVIRIASHETTKDELLAADRGYQRSSTHVISVCGTHEFERVVDVVDKDLYFGITDPVTGTNNQAYTEIADLTSPEDFVLGVPIGQAATGAKGYLVDSDLAIPAPDYAEFLKDTRIEKAQIKWDQSMTLGNAIQFIVVAGIPGAVFWNLFADDSVSTTDHNGFFWMAMVKVFGSTVNIDEVRVGNFLPTNVAIQDDNSPFNGRTQFGMDEIAVRSTSDDVKNFARTFLIGRAAQSGPLQIGIFGASVINTHGGVTKTDTNGDYRFPTYVDTYEARENNINRRADDVIVFEGSPLCKTLPEYFDHQYNIIIQDATLNGSPPDYDGENPYPVPIALFFIVASATSICAEKRGSDIIYGIAYYDALDRRCAAVTIPELEKHFLFYTEKNPDTGALEPLGRPRVFWSIFSEPPVWAVKYQWLRTDNLQLNSYLQWIVNKAIYITKNQTDFTAPVTLAQADFLVLDMQSIGYYVLNDHPDAVIPFTFQAGDRVRFITDELGNFFTEYRDYEIVKVLGQNYIYLYPDANFEVKDNYQIEIYSPRNRALVTLFYEFGECYEVKTAVINGVRRKYHAGQIQDQSFGTLPLEIVTPATGEFKTGSAYYRRRQISTQAILASVTPPVLPSSGGPKVITVDDQSISDFYLSKDQSIGRVLSTAEVIGEIYRPSAVRFANRYISGTKENGLSSWEALNEKQFSTSYGLIAKLFLRDNTVLVAIFDNSYSVSMYINQGVLREAQGQSLIAISEDVIPRTHVSQRTFGSSNPESITLNDKGDLEGWDEKQGSWWRMSGNEMIDLTDYYMNNYFKPKGALRITKDRKKSKVPAVYDLGYSEMIGSFNELFDNPGKAPEVIILLPDYLTSDPTGMGIKITVVPLNLILCQFTTFVSGNTASIVAVILNLTAQTSGNGFSATVEPDGRLKITAPNNAAVYGNQGLTVEIEGATEKSYHFSAGQIATTGTPDAAETIAFIMDKNLWPQFYPFVPEYYGRIRNDVIVFQNGELWLQDKNPIHNNYFGVQYRRQLKYVCNPEWEKVKNFLNIAQSAENINYCPVITVPPGPQTPIGMLSELKKNHFKIVTNKFYAPFLRDKNDPLQQPALKAWIDGRVLNGQSLTVTLEDDSTEKSALMSSTIHYFYSEYS